MWQIWPFSTRFFNIAPYYLNCLAISRFSDSPWDLEAKSWDRELIPQTMSLTVKPWKLAGLLDVLKSCPPTDTTCLHGEGNIRLFFHHKQKSHLSVYPGTFMVIWYNSCQWSSKKQFKEPTTKFKHSMLVVMSSSLINSFSRKSCEMDIRRIWRNNSGKQLSLSLLL